MRRNSWILVAAGLIAGLIISGRFVILRRTRRRSCNRGSHRRRSPIRSGQVSRRPSPSRSSSTQSNQPRH